jgi:hypothetical protein
MPSQLAAGGRRRHRQSGAEKMAAATAEESLPILEMAPMDRPASCLRRALSDRMPKRIAPP